MDGQTIEVVLRERTKKVTIPADPKRPYSYESTEWHPIGLLRLQFENYRRLGSCADEQHVCFGTHSMSANGNFHCLHSRVSWTSESDIGTFGLLATLQCFSGSKVCSGTVMLRMPPWSGPEDGHRS